MMHDLARSKHALGGGRFRRARYSSSRRVGRRWQGEGGKGMIRSSGVGGRERSGKGRRIHDGRVRTGATGRAEGIDLAKFKTTRLRFRMTRRHQWHGKRRHRYIVLISLALVLVHSRTRWREMLCSRGSPAHGDGRGHRRGIGWTRTDITLTAVRMLVDGRQEMRSISRDRCKTGAVIVGVQWIAVLQQEQA